LADLTKLKQNILVHTIFNVNSSTVLHLAILKIILHEVHGLIDADLVDLGEKFYLPVLRNIWQNLVSEKVLYAKF